VFSSARSCRTPENSGYFGALALGGPAQDAELDGPHGVYYHPVTKSVYISDSRNKRVLKVSP